MLQGCCNPACRALQKHPGWLSHAFASICCTSPRASRAGHSCWQGREVGSWEKQHAVKALADQACMKPLHGTSLWRVHRRRVAAMASSTLLADVSSFRSQLKRWEFAVAIAEVQAT